jgi:hypothetical protein
VAGGSGSPDEKGPVFDELVSGRQRFAASFGDKIDCVDTWLAKAQLLHSTAPRQPTVPALAVISNPSFS